MITFCPGIQDSKTVFKYVIRQNLRPVIFFQDSFVKPTYINMVLLICNEFSRDFKNIYREEIDDLRVKSFTGCYSGLISYLKTVLES